MALQKTGEDSPFFLTFFLYLHLSPI